MFANCTKMLVIWFHDTRDDFFFGWQIFVIFWNKNWEKNWENVFFPSGKTYFSAKFHTPVKNLKKEKTYKEYEILL